MGDCARELTGKLGDNIKRITYITELKLWLIHYKDSLVFDILKDDEILAFLKTKKL